MNRGEPKMSKTIGLCIAFNGTNYGMHLQGYATQHVIEKSGFETEIIDYHSGANKGIKFSAGALYVGLRKITNKIEKRFSHAESLDVAHQENSQLRKNASDAFRENRLHNIIKCNGIDELKRRSNQYFAVLVGSDQIWLPDVAFSNFYTLRFAAPGVRRISYATSLGVSAYPNYAKKAAEDFWKQIDFLSVREQQGKDIIQSIVNVPVEVVADPTYLLTKEEWLELIPQEKVIEDKYILCYFLGDSEPIKQYARKFADSKGLRLVSILSNECNSDDSKFADDVLIGKSPEEFVNLIRNAEFILTDSFHGLAFSVINQKQFLIFYRRRTDVKESRNSRIDNIVRSWDIEDRLIREPEMLEFPTSDIDYAAVAKKVEALREKSLAFLDKALNS
ncbi:MAG: polysaccharide pyruvyl transferase family protein [Flavobacteriales bacterium]|nr:polysaccharide pyruvyl transferase family protein [Flavobacteriales bacterium]